MRIDPKSNNRCPYKKRGDTETHRGEGHVKTETETGVRWPQAKECLEPPRAGRGRKDPAQVPLEALGSYRHKHSWAHPGGSLCQRSSSRFCTSPEGPGRAAAGSGAETHVCRSGHVNGHLSELEMCFGYF